MPNLRTTHIGSFPFAGWEPMSLEVAVELAVEESFKYDVPAMPQLPHPSDRRYDPSMLQELENPGTLVSAKSFKRIVAERKPEAVKIQSCGPVTAVKYGGYDRTVAVDKISEHIQGLVDGLVGMSDLYIFLDEPAISDKGVGVYYPLLWRNIFGSLNLPKGVNVFYGVHTCNSLTKGAGELLRYLGLSGVKVLSINALESRFMVSSSAEDNLAYRRFRDQGGRICWGVVGLRNDRVLVGVADRESFYYKNMIYDDDFLSPVCGLFGYSSDDCTRTSAHLARLKQVFNH